MSKIVVLKTEGKREDVNHVTVMLFENLEDANKYCAENTEKGKYWSFAEIINPADRLEIYRMENIVV